MPKQSPIHNHSHQSFVTMDTQQGSLPRAASLENFRKHMDATLSGRKSTKSSDGNLGGFMRKAKSDSDVAMQTLKKKVEVCVFVLCVYTELCSVYVLYIRVSFREEEGGEGGKGSVNLHPLYFFALLESNHKIITYQRYSPLCKEIFSTLSPF